MFAKLVQLVSLPLASIAYMAKPPYYSRGGGVQIHMYSEIKKKTHLNIIHVSNI